MSQCPHEAAQESSGERLRTRQNFISLETLEATERVASSHGSSERRSLVRRAQTLLRSDKEQFIRNIAEEVDGYFLANDLRPTYQALRKLNSNPSSRMIAIRSVDGQIISDHVGVRERWAEYFEQLYLANPTAVSLDVSVVAIPVPDPPIIEDSLTLTEAMEAISKPKGGKAPGLCDIYAELLKARDEPMARCLHTILAAIWQSGSIPPDLLMGVVIPLWKGKGDRWDWQLPWHHVAQ
ncbi:uncharacterized protein [Penaeus vannamei]|uniref:uncharacterized protein n=1 Tax=Penaeus vannamei TaxID=6689 RepID=UPI00387F712D